METPAVQAGRDKRVPNSFDASSGQGCGSIQWPAFTVILLFFESASILLIFSSVPSQQVISLLVPHLNISEHPENFPAFLVLVVTAKTMNGIIFTCAYTEAATAQHSYMNSRHNVDDIPYNLKLEWEREHGIPLSCINKKKNIPYYTIQQQANKQKKKKTSDALRQRI